MAKVFRLEIITPVEILFDDQVIHFRAPGVAGDFGVLADHAPMMTALKAGRLQVDFQNRSEDYAVSGGYLEVHENRAVILAETCIHKENIDLPRAQRARERAIRKLEEATTPEDREEWRAALNRALTRIHVAEGK